MGQQKKCGIRESFYMILIFACFLKQKMYLQEVWRQVYLNGKYEYTFLKNIHTIYIIMPFEELTIFHFFNKNLISSRKYTSEYISSRGRHAHIICLNEIYSPQGYLNYLALVYECLIFTRQLFRHMLEFITYKTYHIEQKNEKQTILYFR